MQYIKNYKPATTDAVVLSNLLRRSNAVCRKKYFFKKHKKKQKQKQKQKTKKNIAFAYNFFNILFLVSVSKESLDALIGKVFSDVPKLHDKLVERLKGRGESRLLCWRKGHTWGTCQRPPPVDVPITRMEVIVYFCRYRKDINQICKKKIFFSCRTAVGRIARPNRLG